MKYSFMNRARSNGGLQTSKDEKELQKNLGSINVLGSQLPTNTISKYRQLNDKSRNELNSSHQTQSQPSSIQVYNRDLLQKRQAKIKD